MIKRILGVIFILLFFILLFYPFLSWQFDSKKALSVAVMDKTVPQNDYREHKGLYWVLDHKKVRDPSGESYQLESDYYGYDPEEYQGDESFEIPDPVDLIYVADTYGVYDKDLQGNPLGERSELLYGGLTIYEWNQIMMNKTDENTLIVEFNSLASPTNPSVRKLVEKNLGITWTGWIGRYFKELDDGEVPVWLRENWERQHDQEWKFKGKGLAFVNDHDYVIVLPSEDVHDKVQFKWEKEARSLYPDAVDGEYGYWFDIIQPTEEVDVEARYELAISPKAEELLEDNGIPASFPAILHNKERKTYYFAGDYADVGEDYYARWSMPSWYKHVNSFFNADDAFFWKVYAPLMESIIDAQSSVGESDV
ncbi:hypothetical protein LCL89_07175 [Halobacillus yeomjeoni]|uniref:hypothetical protein n=1 Tax=Halobacillus yeomjeoni TaxID=311194 RepID=UPI001CD38FC9|nr:hypothetical protein [Halobacillus yeomjeoni]MCA0983839.1 hypothetical protein [Halobacillus yeomjeoni]